MFLAPWQWCVMKGNMLHAGQPYFGTRASIVLFCHDAIRGELPTDVTRTATSLGLTTEVETGGLYVATSVPRNSVWSDDWRIHDALIEGAESTLNLVGASYEDVRVYVKEGRNNSNLSSAVAVLPLCVLTFLLLAAAEVATRCAPMTNHRAKAVYSSECSSAYSGDEQGSISGADIKRRWLDLLFSRIGCVGAATSNSWGAAYYEDLR
jgi:hypothetical protein